MPNQKLLRHGLARCSVYVLACMFRLFLLVIVYLFKIEIVYSVGTVLLCVTGVSQRVSQVQNFDTYLSGNVWAFFPQCLSLYSLTCMV